MKKMLFLLFIVILAMTLKAEWITVTQDNESELVTFQQTRVAEIELTFHLDGYEQENLIYNNIEYKKLSHPESGSLCEEGKPDLPIFTKVIAIPVQGDVNQEILSYQSRLINDVVIYPCEILNQESESQEQFIIDENYYRNGGIFPSEFIRVGEPAIMRDMRVLPITFCPFRYNAETKNLELYTEISIRINISESGGRNCKQRNGAISRSFEPMYKAEILNYAENMTREDYQLPTILFIAPDDADVLENLVYLTDWKRQKGFEVGVVTTAEAGETAASIKDYIQNAYDTWDNPPGYICLVGDADGNYAIPTWFASAGYGEGDHPYGQLEGDDQLLDANLGRLSFNSILTLQVLITKILNYEKTPYTGDTEWFQKALLIGDPMHSGYSTVFTMLGIKEMMLTYPDNWDGDEDFYEVYSSPFPSQIVNAVNAGVLYMFYRGYLGTSNWSPGQENNGFMLPFASLITCGTGSFANGGCPAETFTRMGTITNPAGAIGAVGQATAGNHTCFNNALSLGIASGIFQHNIYSMGGALTMGKYYMWSLYPQNPGNFISQYLHYNSLMGDPSLELWTGVPQELFVSYNDHIATGENWFQVSVLDSVNVYAENAWVTLTSTSPEEFAVSAVCDVYGQVLLPVTNLPVGEYNLTVSKHDHIPFMASISVVQPEQYVDISDIQYIEISGNGDGVLNPGEIVDLDITLENYGNLPVSGAVATMTSESNLVTITNAVVDFGDIDPNATANPPDNFRIEINPAALDGVEPVLNLSITDNDGHEWTTWHIPVITAANLWISDVIIEGDHILDPGETEQIYIELTNTGFLATDDISGMLFCADHRLTVLDSLGEFGSIEPGEIAANIADRFTLQASENIYPGTQINFQLQLTSESGYDDLVSFSIPVGIAEVTDPCGPDAYGYWAFDDEDEGYENCPAFEWLEIDPVYGGEGEYLSIQAGAGTGAVQVIDLPESFSFSFYGVEYEQITVCSNGWIAPGIHEAASFMNWYIPSPQGPSPMIAVFWDDLNTIIGEVCYLYDQDNHLLIVEWSRIKNGDTDSEETFEVILYDAEYQPTITGDSKIKMQYLVVNNDNAGSYPSNHGQYCAAGLENSDSTIGLLYTFNNEYPPANKPLENETAISFSSEQYHETPILFISNFYISAGDDEYIESGETVYLNIEFENYGLTAAENINLEISLSDPYIEILNSTSELADILPGESAWTESPVSFSVSEAVPDFYNFIIAVNIESGEYCWNRNIQLTAYLPNIFSVDQDSIHVQMNLNQTESRTFELTNIGDETVEFFVRTDEITPSQRDLTGSCVTCNTTDFMPGQTTNWTFTIFNRSEDDEWITDVWIVFPPGVTLNYATDGFGGSGGLLVWDGATGTEQIVNWHGVSPNGFGVLHDSEIALINANVTLGSEFAGDINLFWQLDGDFYGMEPHTITGQMTFLYPLRWITLDTSYGILEPGESSIITINLDSSDIEAGLHHALIDITSHSWDCRKIHVTMEALTGNDDNNQLPNHTALLGNYPNPFNPSTAISFQIPEASFVELTIYNIRGQAVRKLADQYLEAGKHILNWDGCDDQGNLLSSGIYLYKLKTGEDILNAKMMLIK